MNDDLYLYIAIFVFTLLLIGLTLTVSEFKKMGDESDKRQKEKDRANLDEQ